MGSILGVRAIRVRPARRASMSAQVEGRQFGRESRLQALKLVRERSVTLAQAARDPDPHMNLLRGWILALRNASLSFAVPVRSPEDWQ